MKKKRPWELPEYQRKNQFFLYCEDHSADENEKAWSYLGLGLVDAILPRSGKRETLFVHGVREKLFDKLSDYRARKYCVAYIADALTYLQEDLILDEFRDGSPLSKVNRDYLALLNRIIKDLKELQTIRVRLDFDEHAETPNAFDRPELTLPLTRYLARNCQSYIEGEKSWAEDNLKRYVRGGNREFSPRRICISRLYFYFREVRHPRHVQEVKELIEMATGKPIKKVESFKREIAAIKAYLKVRGRLPARKTR